MSIFGLLIYLVFLGISVYCLVLFIKLAHRGIRALDIYINQEEDRRRIPDSSYNSNDENRIG